MKMTGCLVFMILMLTLAHCTLAANYMKMWGPPENGEPARFDIEMSPQYEQALLKKLQAYMEANRAEGLWPLGASSDDVPAKRQIRYHQCYFNPISCFRKRK